MELLYFVYGLLWGDLVTIPLPGGGSLGLSLLVLILVPAGVYFTVRTRFLPIRLFKDMIQVTLKKSNTAKGSISGFQSLIVSTATRVGMGNLAGVVAAISAGGAGAVFWMWITALLGASTSFAESVLAQKYREPDPLYGGYRGGPAQYIHAFVSRKKPGSRKSTIAILFALSGLLCWGGISQVIGNSVAESMENAFSIPPAVTAAILVAISAIIVLRKNTTVKVLDVVVPIMAGCFFAITVIIIIKNVALLPTVLQNIFAEAFGLRQAVAGGFGAVVMNGVKRGLFSNEAGSGSAPCAAAAADGSSPAEVGLLQAFGVIIDTIIICTCSAFIMLLAPADLIEGLGGMDLLQTAMDYHMGYFGVVFIAVTLLLFCFSTFLGILYYARSNVAYVFGDNWTSQTVYKIFCLIMLGIGCIATYTFVWDLGDVGIALMTIFNMIVLIPMAGESMAELKKYEQTKK
ncbi:MAG: alanine:cation symporter family protein [Firmicutes bacterium]|nr:alanine:cation symporter family protein [Bacillota bacterium]